MGLTNQQEVEFPDDIKPGSFPANSRLPSCESAEDTIEESGRSTTHYDRYANKPIVRLLMGEQGVNWPLPDTVFAVKFVFDNEAMSLPMGIKGGTPDVRNYQFVVVAVAPQHRWSRRYTLQWGIDVARSIWDMNPLAHVWFVTAMPRSDDMRMAYINFNRNLAAVVHNVKRIYKGPVQLLPVHRFALAEFDLPLDGVYRSYQLREVREYYIKTLGLGAEQV